MYLPLALGKLFKGDWRKPTKSRCLATLCVHNSIKSLWEVTVREQIHKLSRLLGQTCVKKWLLFQLKALLVY